MPEKLTLSAYLAKRGKKAKALKRGEAEAFGIPWPLQAGWPWRYGAMEITPEMIADAESRIREAKSKPKVAPVATEVPMSMPHVTRPEFFGFVLRQARRYRVRRPAPWA
jgi:hypothetical protein